MHINTPIGTPPTTPMQIACRLGHKHIVKWLMKKGEDATTSALMGEETLAGYKLCNANENENSYTEEG